jgi:signal transduction histidine kinase
LEQVHPEDREIVLGAARDSLATGRSHEIEYRMRHKDGSWRTLESHGAVIRNPSGAVDGILIVARDITERKRAEQDRVLMELQLRQAQKLESIGQLAAGIAHEINTPTQYIGDNTHFLQESTGGLFALLKAHERLADAVTLGESTEEPLRELRNLREQIDSAYLLEEIPRAIQQSIEGVERVSRIVGAMKDFSHPGTAEKTPMDLNRAIDSTITVARNEWKYVAEVVRDYDPDLPAVPCLPGEFHQVILNLLVNAAHAIAQANGTEGNRKGRITVSTRRRDDRVEIRIEDTGCGIPEAIRNRVFEPFFTTKPLGKGTGQGLAIARSAIVDKHGGELDFESGTDGGTTFIVRLPLGADIPNPENNLT